MESSILEEFVSSIFRVKVSVLRMQSYYVGRWVTRSTGGEDKMAVWLGLVGMVNRNCKSRQQTSMNMSQEGYGVMSSRFHILCP
jgi:hypothetical protein